ncbi:MULTISPECIES: DUF5818 domain-containing protein [Thalassospira]|jgi:hypothetical protein|uniref:Lipoprotein n=3 Tax=Thalassospira TaxID=168934 RepID=A0A853L1S2_9PROT|nr:MULTISPECIES: DUF5818 domain-containing protein [Thalassospira]OAZ12742.1 hypothetical protein TH15_15100 [Thalassospira profundimaris]AXO14739.1 hypothetical protein DY252_11345 [Thalassospira indica]EKF07798.1 hypothetical protein TH2_12657 [Thalassospira profundimaris WP0211]KZC98075.1 hypothetical protein AUQ41_17645 [Thalassospira sp. MCCC 1A02898]MBE72273.1 hypothetical protein [Thalassospira sp.]|tara:strand:- start:6 stop:314 length:309 start_codon:yes stop_codon:yes gene_type:complete
MKYLFGAGLARKIAVAGVALALAGCSFLQKENFTVGGEITDQGQECVTFRAEDGTLYALANKASRLRPGDKVRITGHLALMTTCTEATTLIVDKIVLLAPAD